MMDLLLHHLRVIFRSPSLSLVVTYTFVSTSRILLNRTGHEDNAPSPYAPPPLDVSHCTPPPDQG